MDKQTKAEQKRSARSKRGPGFSIYGRLNGAGALVRKRRGT